MNDLPALNMEPAPVGVNGDLATIRSTASLACAGLPCHARVVLGSESTRKLGASRRKERCSVDEIANHDESLLWIRCRILYGA